MLGHQTLNCFLFSIQGGKSCAKARKRRKVWTQTKILSPNMRYLVAILRFVTIYILFGLWASRGLFWVINNVSWARCALIHGVFIAFYTESNLQNSNYAQKRCICRENSQQAPDENFYGHLCPRRKAVNFCQPVSIQTSPQIWMKRLISKFQATATTAEPHFFQINSGWRQRIYRGEILELGILDLKMMDHFLNIEIIS